MSSFVETYFNILKFVLTSMLVLLLVPVLLQVLARFMPFIPRYIWTEELARFSFIWIIMIGSSIAVREQTHFHVDILPTLPKSWEHKLRILLLMLMLLLAIIFVVGGYQFARFGSTQHSEIAGLPMLAIYIAWPLAGLSWIVFLIEQVYQHFQHSQKS